MWIVFITLSAFLWAIVNIVDKTLLGGWLPNPSPIFFRYCIMAVIVGIAGILWSGTIIHGTQLVLVILAGIAATMAWVCYFAAIRREEVSRVIPVYGLEPIIVLLVGTTVLHESIAAGQIGGAVLIIVGSLTLNPISRIRASRGALLIAIAASFIAVQTLSSKIVLDSYEPTTVFFHNLVIVGGVGLFVRYLFWKNVEIRSRSARAGLWLYAAGFFLPSLFFYLALSGGPASLVSPLAASQYAFLFFATLIVGRWRPGFLKECVSQRTIAVKAVSIALIITGIFLIA